MNGITLFLTRHWFLFAIAFLVPLGYYYPASGQILYPKSSYLAAVAIFLTGLNLQTKDIEYKRNIVLGLIISNLITFIACPILFISISKHLTFLSKEHFQGIAVLSVMPTTIVSHVVLTRVAKGNVMLSAMNTVVSNLLALIAIPIVLGMILSQELTPPVGQLLKNIILVLILPLFLSQMVKYIAPGLIKDREQLYTRLAQVIVLIFILIGLSVNHQSLFETDSPDSLTIQIPLLLIFFHGLLLAIAFLSGKAMKLPRKELVSVMFSASQKTLPAGIAIISVSFHQAVSAAMIILLYHLIQLIIDSFLSQRLNRTL